MLSTWRHVKFVIGKGILHHRNALRSVPIELSSYHFSPNKSALPNGSSPPEKPLNQDNIMNIC